MGRSLKHAVVSGCQLRTLCQRTVGFTFCEADVGHVTSVTGLHLGGPLYYGIQYTVY